MQRAMARWISFAQKGTEQMFLSLFNLEPTGNYRQVEPRDHWLCAHCLERKPNFLAYYRFPYTTLGHARKLCWVCLNKDYLKTRAPVFRSGFSSGLIGPPDGGAA